MKTGEKSKSFGEVISQDKSKRGFQLKEGVSKPDETLKEGSLDEVELA